MSNLLINEPPLMVLPTLASKIGLNEAIVLQQIHYWLDPRGTKNLREGKHWVYNSYKDWKKQFPFWSSRSIQRTVLSLEKKGLLISKCFSKNPLDKTKWYTIDYSSLSLVSKDFSRMRQNGTIENAKEAHRICQNGTIYNKDTETTPDKTSSLNPSSTELEDPKAKRRKEHVLDKNSKLSSMAEKRFEDTSTNPTVLKDCPGKQPTDFMNLKNTGSAESPTAQTHSQNEQAATQMLQFWNESVGQGREPVTLIFSRLKDLENTLKNSFEGNVDHWKAYCLKIASSKFLMGETEHAFQVSLDWAIKPKVIQDITGGKYTLGTRENTSPSMIPVDTETKTAIQKAEETLIESIRSGRQDIPFREVFIKRIQFGFEGVERKRVLETYGWERGGFSRLLEDYINDITFRATKYDSGKTLEEERVSW